MISLLKKLGQVLYRIWFYILVTLPIVVFLPFLLIVTLSEKWHSQFYWMARNLWAAPILYGMGCPPRITWEQTMEKGKSYMIVANHTSMLDIMLMLRVHKYPFVFVGKKELVNIPLFGYFYKKVCILVDRDDSRSRTAVYRRAQRRLYRGLSICIFPEGGVPDDDILLDAFKDGAFKMAIAHRIPVVPITFYDNKKRLPFSFSSGCPGVLRAKVHPFFDPSFQSGAGKTGLRDAVRAVILKELQNRDNPFPWKRPGKNSPGAFRR